MQDFEITLDSNQLKNMNKWKILSKPNYIKLSLQCHCEPEGRGNPLVKMFNSK